MATPVIESADIAGFEALQAYDWTEDREFQAGLQAILSSAPTPSQAAELTLRAKCFFFSKKSGIPLNFDAYKFWLSQQLPDSGSPPNPNQASTICEQIEHSQQGGIHNTASAEGTPIDTSSPKFNSEEYPDNAPSLFPHSGEFDEPPLVTGKTDAPYPMSFAHIVELITTGQPIPGIREIPNVLNTALPSEATRPKRLKPWEVAKSAEEVKTEEAT
ncbi:hypothetical protein RUND412_008434 [Rhizina undulata]